MESEVKQHNPESASGDGKADAIAAIALITLFVVTVTFWVAGQ